MFFPACFVLFWEYAHPVQILISYTIISNIPCNKMDWIPRLRFEVIHTFKTIISMYSTSCDINHSKPPELGGSNNSPFCNLKIMRIFSIVKFGRLLMNKIQLLPKKSLWSQTKQGRFNKREWSVTPLNDTLNKLRKMRQINTNLLNR